MYFKSLETFNLSGFYTESSCWSSRCRLVTPEVVISAEMNSFLWSSRFVEGIERSSRSGAWEHMQISFNRQLCALIFSVNSSLSRVVNLQCPFTRPHLGSISCEAVHNTGEAASTLCSPARYGIVLPDCPGLVGNISCPVGQSI